MQVAFISKEEFERLVGDIRDILQRNQSIYEKFKEHLD